MVVIFYWPSDWRGGFLHMLNKNEALSAVDHYTMLKSHSYTLNFQYGLKLLDNVCHILSSSLCVHEAINFSRGEGVKFLAGV